MGNACCIQYSYVADIQTFNRYGGGVKSIVFFISNSDFWFLRTYICLYLISPIINSYLVTASKSQYLFILIALGIISVYIGSLTDVDSSLKIGKNLTNFMFCYVVGNAVRRYEKMWRRIPVWQLISVFILYNAFVVAFYCILEGKGLAAKIYPYVFCYNSPGLIFSALLFFMIVLHWQFKSKVINWLASSALAIYLIHESRLVETYILGPISLSIRTNLGNDLLSLTAIGLFAIGICVICIFVDKLLAPIWKWFGQIGECSERKIKTYLLPYINKRAL